MNESPDIEMHETNRHPPLRGNLAPQIFRSGCRHNRSRTAALPIGKRRERNLIDRNRCWLAERRLGQAQVGPSSWRAHATLATGWQRAGECKGGPAPLQVARQRLENWNERRAFAFPYFLRSTTRASRV